MRRVGILVVVMWAVIGCKSADTKPGGTSSSSSSGPAPADLGKVTVRVVYGSEKKTWLEEQVKAFLATSPKLKNGKGIDVDTKAMGSGEAATGIVAGQLKPTVFSPASGVYVTLLNQSWLSAAGHVKAIAPAGEPLVLSPVVIAMWKPMAEALGWPDKRLGWSDLLKVNADPRGWGAFGHPEWGRFKLGHTHPAYSNSGFLAILAEAYAGAKKTRGLSREDLDAKATVDFVNRVEQTIVHYGKSTGFFAEKMVARGPTYLSAAVLYENVVIESYDKSPPLPLVAIYPVEGTFWSDHPYSVLDGEWVTPEQREAAEALLAFLRSRPAQERALALGFRPADPKIAMGAPIDAAHGVDPKQPETLLDTPDAQTLARLLELWRATKKTTDAILVFDKSGSMAGRPLAEAKTGTKAFLDVLHDTDEVTLMLFSGKLERTIGPVKLAEGKAELIRAIDAVEAGGGTALYDTTMAAYQAARKRAAAQPGRIHAVVVMTDGQDSGSKQSLSALIQRLDDDAVKVFTIGYGGGADAKVLGQIAETGRGAYSKGSVENIASVFEDMGAFL